MCVLFVLGGLRAPTNAPALAYSLLDMGKGPLGARLFADIVMGMAFIFPACPPLCDPPFLYSIEDRRESCGSKLFMFDGEEKAAGGAVVGFEARITAFPPFVH